MDALERLFIDNGKRMLTTTQIAAFLTSNGLDKKFGIQISEVETDIKTIADKHKQYGNLANVLQQKNAKERTSLTGLLSQIREKNEA